MTELVHSKGRGGHSGTTLGYYYKAAKVALVTTHFIGDELLQALDG